MPPSPKDVKRALRTSLRQALVAMPEARRVRESAELCRMLRLTPAYRKARTVAIFCPMPFEVNLLELLGDSNTETAPANSPEADPVTGAGRESFSQRKRFVFPLTHEDRRLSWHQVADLSELRPGRMGIGEPDPSRSPALDPAGIDLVIVPGLGFTPEGGRLGFGGGYYDRFLKKIGPHTTTVALCFSCQIVPSDQLPLEPHDIPVQQVLQAGL